jgi:hypothetical protein
MNLYTHVHILHGGHVEQSSVVVVSHKIFLLISVMSVVRRFMTRITSGGVGILGGDHNDTTITEHAAEFVDSRAHYIFHDHFSV